jgi:hypothetical protein
MRLVKFVCAAKAHADGHGDSALTIHDGAWAFCPRGGAAVDHDWQPSDGLRLADAMRLGSREPAPAETAKPVTLAARGRARER